eukprot:tig00021038_g17566.t1
MLVLRPDCATLGRAQVGRPAQVWRAASRGFSHVWRAFGWRHSADFRDAHCAPVEVARGALRGPLALSYACKLRTLASRAGQGKQVLSAEAVMTERLKELARARRCEEAESLFESALRREPGLPRVNAYHWSALISGLLRGNLEERAGAWVHRMLELHREGGGVTRDMYSAALATYRALALAKYREFGAGERWAAAAEALLEEAAARGRADGHCFQIAFDLLVRTGLVERAEGVLERARGTGLRPGVEFFTAAVSACAEAADWRGGAAAWDMMIRSRVPPDVIAWGSYLRLCLRCVPEAGAALAPELAAAGQPADAAGLARLVQRRMEAAGVPFSTVCHCIVLERLVESGELAGAEAWLRQARRSAAAKGSALYSPFLELAARSGDAARGRELLAMMREDRLRVDPPQLSQLVRCFTRARAWDEVGRLAVECEEQLTPPLLSVLLDAYGFMKGAGLEPLQRLLDRLLRGGDTLKLFNVNVVCRRSSAAGRGAAVAFLSERVPSLGMLAVAAHAHAAARGACWPACGRRRRWPGAPGRPRPPVELDERSAVRALHPPLELPPLRPSLLHIQGSRRPAPLRPAPPLPLLPLLLFLYPRAPELKPLAAAGQEAVARLVVRWDGDELERAEAARELAPLLPRSAAGASAAAVRALAVAAAPARSRPDGSAAGPAG